MRLSRLRTVGLSMAAMLTVACGCSGAGGPAPSSSTAEGTVSGTVKVKGKSVGKGEISFDPANARRKDVSARTAPIGKDGTYTVKTLVGSNMVRVDAGALTATREMQR